MNERTAWGSIGFRELLRLTQKKKIILGPFILCGHLLPCHFQGEGGDEWDGRYDFEFGLID